MALPFLQCMIALLLEGASNASSKRIVPGDHKRVTAQWYSLTVQSQGYRDRRSAGFSLIFIPFSEALRHFALTEEGSDVCGTSRPT